MSRKQNERYAILTDYLHWAVHEQFCLGASSEDEYRLALVVMLREMADSIAEKVAPDTICPSKR